MSVETVGDLYAAIPRPSPDGDDPFTVEDGERVRRALGAENVQTWTRLAIPARQTSDAASREPLNSLVASRRLFLELALFDATTRLGDALGWLMVHEQVCPGREPTFTEWRQGWLDVGVGEGGWLWPAAGYRLDEAHLLFDSTDIPSNTELVTLAALRGSILPHPPRNDPSTPCSIP